MAGAGRRCARRPARPGPAPTGGRPCVTRVTRRPAGEPLARPSDRSAPTWWRAADAGPEAGFSVLADPSPDHLQHAGRPRRCGPTSCGATPPRPLFTTRCAGNYTHGISSMSRVSGPRWPSSRPTSTPPRETRERARNRAPARDGPGPSSVANDGRGGAPTRAPDRPADHGGWDTWNRRTGRTTSWAAPDPPPGRGRRHPLARTGGGAPGPPGVLKPVRSRDRTGARTGTDGANEGCGDLEQVRGRSKDRGARSWIPRMRSAPKESSCQPRTKTPATIR